MPDARAELATRLTWARRWRGLLMHHAGELARASGDRNFAEGVLAPLAAHCRWHERFARGVLGTRRLGPAPVWLRRWRTRTAHHPVGDVRLTEGPSQLLLGVDLLQSVVAGNAVDIDGQPRTGGRPGLSIVDLAQRAGERLQAIRIRRSVAEPDTDARAPARDVRAAGHPVMTGIGLVLPGADVRAAAAACWGALHGLGPGIVPHPVAVYVAEPIADAFHRALRPIAGGARPVRLGRADAEASYALARDAAGAGAASASGVLESGDAQGRFRPVVMIETPPDVHADVTDTTQQAALPVLLVTRVLNADEAGAIARSLPHADALAVFGGRAGDLDAVPTTAVATHNAWPAPLAHPAETVDVGGRPVGGPAGLLARTRPRTVSVGRTSRLLSTPEAPPATARGDHNVPAWLTGLYRASTGGVRLDLPPRRPPPSARPGRPEPGPQTETASQAPRGSLVDGAVHDSAAGTPPEQPRDADEPAKGGGPVDVAEVKPDPKPRKRRPAKVKGTR